MSRYKKPKKRKQRVKCHVHGCGCRLTLPKEVRNGSKLKLRKFLREHRWVHSRGVGAVCDKHRRAMAIELPHKSFAAAAGSQQVISPPGKRYPPWLQRTPA